MSEHPELLIVQTPHLSDEQLAAWATDELARDERDTLQRHLTSCEVCRGALAETQRIGALIRAARSKANQVSGADISVVQRVLAQLNDEKLPSPPPTPVRGEVAIPAYGIAPTANRRRDVWRRVGALAAVLLLIAMSALLFTRLGGRGPAVTSTSTFTPGPDPLGNIPGAWAQVLPDRGGIRDVAVVSPTDIWAVGGIGTPNDSRSQDVLILHFDGKLWHRSPESFPGASLSSISMVSANEGWASGAIDVGNPFLLHYINGHWRDARTSLTLPNTPGLKYLTLDKIQMASATSGWMLASPVVNQTGVSPTDVYEYHKSGDGYRWEPIFSFDNVSFTALAAVSDHEVWFVGSRGPHALAIHLTVNYLNNDPHSYVINRDTREFDIDALGLSSISMRSPTDGWASGGDDINGGTLFHWDGQKWAPKPVAQAEIDGVVMTGENTGWVYNRFYNQGVGYLYSTAGNRWFRYPLASDEMVVTGAAITPTTFLAIVDSFKDLHNPVPVPRVYTMGQGTPLPTPPPYVAP